MSIVLTINPKIKNTQKFTVLKNQHGSLKNINLFDVYLLKCSRKCYIYYEI